MEVVRPKSKLSRQAGHFGGHNTEGMIILAILGIFAAIEVPAIIGPYRSANAECIRNLALQESERCRLSGKAYEDGACVGDHLFTSPRFLDGRIVQTVPAGTIEDGGTVEVSDGSFFSVTLVTRVGDKRTVVSRETLVQRLGVGPLFFLFGVFLIGMNVYGIFQDKSIGGCLMFPIWAVGLIFAYSGFCQMHDREFEFSRGQVVVRQKVVGLTFIERTIRPVVVGYPGSSDAGPVILIAKNGVTWHVMDYASDEIGMAGQIHHAVFPNETKSKPDE